MAFRRIGIKDRRMYTHHRVHLAGRNRSLLFTGSLMKADISEQVVPRTTPFIGKPSKTAQQFQKNNCYTEVSHAFRRHLYGRLDKDGTMVPNGSGLPANSISMMVGMVCRVLKWTTERNWSLFRRQVGGPGKVIPMMYCSPDFTRTRMNIFVEKRLPRQKRWIDMTAALGRHLLCRGALGTKTAGTFN